MADVTFVSLAGGSPFVAGGSVVPVAMPSGYAADDALIVGVQVQPRPEGNYSVNGIDPADGWLALNTTVFAIGGGFGGLKLFYKYADGSEGSTQNFPTFSGASSETYRYQAVAYRGAAPDVYVVNSTFNGVAGDLSTPSYSTNRADTVVGFFSYDNWDSKDAGATLRSASLSATRPIVLDKVTGPGTTAALTLFGSDNPSAVIQIGLTPVNSAPYAPTLTSMADGGFVDVNASNTAFHTFDDPDEDLDRPEGQSGFKEFWRAIGAPTWTEDDEIGNTDLFYVFPSGTFTDGVSYERQVASIDLAGEEGPRSTSGLFTGAAAPLAATITSHSDDDVITTLTDHFTWDATGQEMYRVLKVADAAGTANPAVVYYDSGPVASAVIQDVILTFPVNNRTEHLQVLYFDGFLWSPRASVRVVVDYVEPPSPDWTMSTDPLTGSLVFEYDTPAPTGGQPTPVRVEFEVADGDDIPREVKEELSNLPLTGTASYSTPRSGRDYALNVWGYSVTADGMRSL